ncbi:hypothetical protein KPNJ2_02933 [Klebsiella pneumoniae 30684/NJST258_2]|uniref:Uncharacterized protein n=1 Tax=Klebsiella pneumoniae 30684/NJST258_2 TaxID=1420013 RepID=W8UVP8_KLEPN|nr:hypothetical protein KPNJ2_02933 [Klebsiella pneumoniae 30684/NJST258_2]
MNIISAFIIHFSFNIYRYFRQNNTSSYRVILIIKNSEITGFS